MDLRRLHQAAEAHIGASAGCADIPWNDVSRDLGLGDMQQPPAVTEAMLRCTPWPLWPGHAPVLSLGCAGLVLSARGDECASEPSSFGLPLCASVLAM